MSELNSLEHAYLKGRSFSTVCHANNTAVFSIEANANRTGERLLFDLKDGIIISPIVDLNDDSDHDRCRERQRLYLPKFIARRLE